MEVKRHSLMDEIVARSIAYKMYEHISRQCNIEQLMNDDGNIDSGRFVFHEINEEESSGAIAYWINDLDVYCACEMTTKNDGFSPNDCISLVNRMLSSGYFRHRHMFESAEGPDDFDGSGISQIDLDVRDAVREFEREINGDK